MPHSSQPPAYAALQEWRRLDRRLTELPADHPDRAQVQRRLAEARRAYQAVTEARRTERTGGA